MQGISQATQKLIQRYQVWHQSLQKKPNISTIHVDEVASKVAGFYEKIRGVVDWKEEHLFRKTAIERVLKRRLFFQRNGGKIADPLIHELIRGGHFPNDTIEEPKIEEIQKSIDKYIFIIENAPSSPKEKITARFHDWILEIAACEIEEILAPPLREKALLDYVTEMMKERIEIRKNVTSTIDISGEERNSQIYIAIQRALFNLDSSLISYNLLTKKYPQWRDLPQDQLEETTKTAYLIQDGIEKDLNHPLADKFYQLCERYDTPYLILGDIVAEDPMKAQEKISQPETLEAQIRYTYEKRAKTLKSRLARAAFYATLSIFLTNILSLYVLEIPLAKFVLGYFSPIAILIDIFIPTLLMFFLIVTIRPASRENLEVVIMEVMKIAYQGQKRETYEIRIYPKRNFIVSLLVALFYLLGFCVFASLIVWGLQTINLPITSHVIFIIFISLITFAGTKIRRRGKELEMVKEKENILSFFLDIFAIPLTQLGKWLSGRWRKYNAIARFFSYLIDMPFQIFIEFVEHWRNFLKEKQEEIH